MSGDIPGTTTKPNATLGGWLLRDISILVSFTGIVIGLEWLAGAAPPIWVSIPLWIIGFVLAYSYTYILHEWGHYIGAQLSASQMPLAPYKGVLIGYFDIQKHSRQQFLWLSWGGVVAYTSSACLLAVIYLSGILPNMAPGLALAGLAFLVQSWAVDLPQIVKVHGGADAQMTNQEGATGPVIIRRTVQTWSVLLAALVLWHWFS